MKIVSINIEKDAHLEKVASFVEREQPDVVCMQEIMGDRMPYFSEKMGMVGTFVPFVILKNWDGLLDGRVMGVAVFTREPHVVLGIHYYQGTEGVLQNLDRAADLYEVHRSTARAVLVVKVNEYVIGTTHFTYTPDGEPDKEQESCLERMLQLTSQYDNLLLCGDFNIPRPNKLYKRLQEEFTDNISQRYDSSLDSQLHRVKGLKNMVDYMWSRGGYKVEDVYFMEGVSDHCAVIASVE